MPVASPRGVGCGLRRLGLLFVARHQRSGRWNAELCGSARLNGHQEGAFLSRCYDQVERQSMVDLSPSWLQNMRIYVLS